MRELSQRRLGRWLKRRAQRYQRRRYGLTAHSIPAPETRYGREWMIGENVPAVRPLGLSRFCVLQPYPLSIARIGPNYPWQSLINNRLHPHELNLNARLDLKNRIRKENRRTAMEDIKHEARAYGRSLARARVTFAGPGS